MTCFLAIDPGLSGAIALWRPATRDLFVEDMPTLTLQRSGKDKRSIDATSLNIVLRRLCRDYDVTLALIEQSGARPNEGLGSAHANGRNWGTAYGALVAQEVRVEIVPPMTWKRDIQCPRDKDGARARASQLLPKHAEFWRLAKHDGRAEAALMALYAERVFVKMGAVA